MPQANGKIWADVVDGVKRGISLADVALCLGENSLDDKTLCMSPKINPYALYAPRWSDRPGLELNKEGFRTIQGYGGAGAPTSPNQAISYIAVNYGVYVPRVSGLHNSDIWYARQIPWTIRRPDANSFGCINHFDGYNHAVKPQPPIREAVVAAGSKIAIKLFTPKSDDETISISQIFNTDNLIDGSTKESYYFACAILVSDINDGPNLLTAPYVFGSSTPISKTAATEQTLTTNLTAQKGKKYMIIPFVTNKPNVTNSTADALCYTLCIASGFESFKEVSTDDNNIVYFRYYEHANTYPDGDSYGSGTLVGNGTNYGFFTFAFLENFSSDSEYSRVSQKYTKVEINFKWSRTTSTGTKSGTVTFSTADSTYNVSRVFHDFTNPGLMLMAVDDNKVWERIIAQGSPDKAAQLTIEGVFYYTDNGIPRNFTMEAHNHDVAVID